MTMMTTTTTFVVDAQTTPVLPLVIEEVKDVTLLIAALLDGMASSMIAADADRAFEMEDE